MIVFCLILSVGWQAIGTIAEELFPLKLFAHVLFSIGQRITINWNAQELSDLLSSVGLQNEVVQSYREFVEHPQAKEIDVFAWLKQGGSDDPWPVQNIPSLPNLTVGEILAQLPTVDQHTRAVLTEFGYSATEINNLYEQGIIV